MLQYALFYPQVVLFIILCKYVNPHSLQHWYCDTVSLITDSSKGNCYLRTKLHLACLMVSTPFFYGHV